MADPFKSMIQDLEQQSPVARSNRTFYVDDDVYEWLQNRFGSARGMSQFVRTVLRKCMEADVNAGSTTK